MENRASRRYLACNWFSSTGNIPAYFHGIAVSCSQSESLSGFKGHRQSYAQWASCQIRKIAGCACAGNAGNVFPRGRLQRKLLVSDPDMHHGTCVTHVPWCMSGSLNRGGGENVPGIPGACAKRNITYLARGPCLLQSNCMPLAVCKETLMENNINLKLTVVYHIELNGTH